MKNRILKSKIFLGILAFFLIFSCTPKKNMVYLEDKESEEIAIEQAKYNGLQIQEGDVIEINVNGYDELAVRPFNLSTMNKTGEEEAMTRTTFQGSEYIVDNDGEINFPTLGKIYVKGMTKQQLVNDVEGRLKDYLRDPLVTVVLKNFNVSVIGEVKSPGQVTSKTEKLNVFQALALAGDMTQYGDRTKVKLIRNVDGTDQIVMLDVNDKRIVSSPYYYLQQNDILYVQPDEKRQVASNQDPNRALYFQLIGAALAVTTLIITLSR